MSENLRKGMKLVKCMNHDVDTSKWSMYAPEGGCDEKLYIDEASTAGLCWKCTSRSVNNLRGGDMSYSEDQD